MKIFLSKLAMSIKIKNKKLAWKNAEHLCQRFSKDLWDLYQGATRRILIFIRNRKILILLNKNRFPKKD